MTFAKLAVAFVSGCAAFFTLPYFPFSTICISSFVLFLANRYFNCPAHYIVLIFAAGLLYTYLRTDVPVEISELSGKRVRIITVLDETPDLSIDKNPLRNLRVRSIVKLENNTGLNVDRINLFVNQSIHRGYIYSVEGLAARDGYYLNPGAGKDNLTVFADTITPIGKYTPSFRQLARNKVDSYLDKNFNPDSAAFLKSIVTGTRAGMSQELRDAFSRTGLAHILSISGAHFGLLMFIVFKCFKFLLSLLPEKPLVRMTIYIRPSQISALMTMPLIISYLMLSSMSYPAIRAFIMISFFMAALLIERRRYLPQSLAIAALIIIIIDPAAIADLSFQLSFLSVLSIFIGTFAFRKDTLTPDAQNPLKIHQLIIQKCVHALRDSALISLSATIGTAPLVAYYFHYFSIISPLSNLLITPLIGFFILPIAIVSSLFFALFDWFPLSSLIDMVTLKTLWAVKALSKAGWADMPVQPFPVIILIACCSSLLAVFAVTARVFHYERITEPLTIPVKLTLALCALLYLAPPIVFTLYKNSLKTGLSITFLDVGQGDSSIVELPDGKRLVIDTGKDGYALSQYLRYRGIRRVDALAISHPHKDHAGGISRLIDEFSINELWDNGMITYTEGLLKGTSKTSLSRGYKLDGREYEITVLHPYSEYMPTRNIENNCSLVLKITGRVRSFLLTGDIEDDAKMDIRHLGDLIRSSVLKMPHHGSYSYESQVLIDAISPEMVVISVGRNNPYKLPSQRTLEMLSGFTIYRTDIDGAVKIEETIEGALSIMTAREFRLQRVSALRDEWGNIRRLFYYW